MTQRPQLGASPTSFNATYTPATAPQVTLTPPTIPNIKGMLPPNTWNTLTTNVKAPVVNTQLPSATPQINEWANQQINLGMQALQQVFQPQTQAQIESGAQRGLTGSGVQDALMNRLAQTQGQTANQMIGGVQGQAMQMNIADLQQLRQLQANQDQANATNFLTASGMNLDNARALADMYQQAALKQGDWESAMSIENAKNTLNTWSTQESNKFNAATLAEQADYHAAQIAQEANKIRLEKNRLSKEDETALKQWQSDTFKLYYDLYITSGGDPKSEEGKEYINKLRKKFDLPLIGKSGTSSPSSGGAAPNGRMVYNPQTGQAEWVGGTGGFGGA